MTKRGAVAVRVTVHADIREMQASEKALQESYNSLSGFLRMHRPCRDEPLAPNPGGILHRLWGRGHLTKQQLYGWQTFWSDLRKERESSNALVGSLAGGSSEGNYPAREMQRATPGPSTRLTREGERARQVWHLLHKHERGLLEQLIRDTLRTEGYKEVHAHSMDYLGKVLSGYSDNRQAVAAATRAVQGVLTSIAEKYNFQPFET